MPKCPACLNQVSLIYQVIAPFQKPSLFFRNLLIARPLDKIMVCNHCRHELTLTAESPKRCTAAGWRALLGLTIILACWIMALKCLLNVDLSDRGQVLLYVSLPTAMALMAAYVQVWNAVTFKRKSINSAKRSSGRF